MSSSIGKVFKNVISARQLPRLEWIFRSHGSWPGKTWKHHKLCEPQLYQISQPWVRVFLFSWISLEVIVQSQSLSFNNIKTLFIIECNLPQFDNFSPKTRATDHNTTQTIHRRGGRVEVRDAEESSAAWLTFSIFEFGKLQAFPFLLLLPGCRSYPLQVRSSPPHTSLLIYRQLNYYFKLRSLLRPLFVQISTTTVRWRSAVIIVNFGHNPCLKR